jgi:hypothetical protein
MGLVGSQDWVVSKLRGSKDLLWKIPVAALATYNSIEPSLRLPLNTRAIASALNCYVLDEARRLFDGVRNSKFIETNGTTYHLLDGCVLWYKQLGPDGMPSNYPTETADSMMQGNFPFMPQRVLLVVGFQLDATLQGIKSVVIQRFNAARRLQFYIELEQVLAKPRVLKMPTIAATVKAKTRVKIKRGPEQKELLAQENV